jgi:hypothetical protein
MLCDIGERMPLSSPIAAQAGVLLCKMVQNGAEKVAG